MSIQGIRLAAYKIGLEIGGALFHWAIIAMISTFFLRFSLGAAFASYTGDEALLYLSMAILGVSISGLVMVGYLTLSWSVVVLMFLCVILTPFVPKEQRVLLRLGITTFWVVNLPKPQRKMARAMRKIIEKEFHVGVSFMTFLGNGDAILLIDPKNAELDVDALAERLQLDAHVHDTLSGLLLLFLELSPYLEIESTRIRLAGIPVVEGDILPGGPVYNLEAEST